MVVTWMGDRLWAGKPSRYVTSHLGQLSLQVPACMAGVKAGCVHLCRVAGITLCDPIWQVTLRIAVRCNSINSYIHVLPSPFTFTVTVIIGKCRPSKCAW